MHHLFLSLTLNEPDVSDISRADIPGGDDPDYASYNSL